MLPSARHSAVGLHNLSIKQVELFGWLTASPASRERLSPSAAMRSGWACAASTRERDNTNPILIEPEEDISSMGTYVDLDGVRTWYDDTGTGDPLVLLHPGGGGVDSRAFGPNIDALAERFRAFTPERRG